MTDRSKPAFPVPMIELMNGGFEWTCYPGLTLREHYAGLALQGVLANSSTSNETYETYDEIAQDAVSIADALIAELEKGE